MAASMARHDEPRAPVTESEVLAQLARSRGPQSLREIAAALNLRHSARRALIKLARKMKKRGEIHEYPNGRIGLPREKQGDQSGAPPQKAPYRDTRQQHQRNAPPRQNSEQREGAK